MNRKNIVEIESSSIGLYIRSTLDITPKWEDMCSIADITELGVIALKRRKMYAH